MLTQTFMQQKVFILQSLFEKYFNKKHCLVVTRIIWLNNPDKKLSLFYYEKLAKQQNYPA